jgi:CHAT domain-containing protein/Tfp pilus assembly protein PilF
VKLALVCLLCAAVPVGARGGAPGTPGAAGALPSAPTTQSADRARAQEATARAWQQQGAGDFEGALASFREALTISRKTGDRAMEGASINWIGLVHQFLGDYATAEESYRRALAIGRETGNREVEGLALFHMGWLHFARHEFNAAVLSYEESLAARRAAGDRKGEGLTLMNLGMTYNSLSQHEKALQYESEALPLVRQYSPPASEADVLDHMGIALTLLRRPEEAIERHTRALEIRRSFGGRWNYPLSLSHRARAYEAMGRTAEAAQDMREVIDIVESGRRNLSTKRFRASLFAGMVGHYEHAINVLMATHDELGAFSMSERARARLTLDAVREALARADSAESGSLFAREDALRDEIDRRRRDVDADTASLEKELRDVEEEIRRRYPKLAEARNADALGADEIRAELLDDQTAVVEYFLGREKSFVFVLTRDAVASYALPPRATIEDAAVRLHALLSMGDQRAKRHELEAGIASLSSMIVKPIPPNIERLIIVPDGALFYVPFAALKGGERYEIVMAPSASTLAMLRRREAAHPPAAASAAVFADPVFSAKDVRVSPHPQPLSRSAGEGGRRPGEGSHESDLLRSAHESGLQDLRRLPATREEANAIAALVRGGTRKALDFDASRATVLSESLGRYRVVHFATHALINAQHPELSGIVLSLVDRGGNPVDGFLRVHDLYRLDGAGELVVLSACRTATGKELRGEGIVGLVSGFMNAGTPRVVASYWDVRDQPTAELMKRFYRAMFTGGATPAAALRTAQRSMRADARWRSPANWAAFALYGLP